MKDKLTKYNQKRDFKKTKEPKGEVKNSRKKLRYVIQHHLASRDHYDLRLEWKGTLKSWAVPKGPSYNSNDKRLAVEVEDHPLDYRSFEGLIPKGQYGGGTVMVWDEGYWYAQDGTSVNFDKGPIKFTLEGKKLLGNWALIKLKNDEKNQDNWLLIKEKDEYSNTNINLNDYDFSTKTGRTMKEIEEDNK